MGSKILVLTLGFTFIKAGVVTDSSHVIPVKSSPATISRQSDDGSYKGQTLKDNAVEDIQTHNTSNENKVTHIPTQNRVLVGAPVRAVTAIPDVRAYTAGVKHVPAHARPVIGVAPLNYASYAAPQSVQPVKVVYTTPVLTQSAPTAPVKIINTTPVKLVYSSPSQTSPVAPVGQPIGTTHIIPVQVVYNTPARTTYSASPEQPAAPAQVIYRAPVAYTPQPYIPPVGQLVKVIPYPSTQITYSAPTKVNHPIHILSNYGLVQSAQIPSHRGTPIPGARYYTSPVASSLIPVFLKSASEGKQYTPLAPAAVPTQGKIVITNYVSNSPPNYSNLAPVQVYYGNGHNYSPVDKTVIPAAQTVYTQ